LIDANVVVEELDVETNFPMPQTVRPRKKTKFFAYEHNDEPKTSFTITVFFNILDQILSSLKDRFENLQNFNDTFGSIYNMFTLTEDELLKSCKHLHVKLQDNAREESDIDGMDMFNEIKSLKIHLQTSNSDQEIDPATILQYVYTYLKIICCLVFQILQ
jgi:hypothetical protein